MKKWMCCLVVQKQTAADSKLLGWQTSHRYRRCSVNTYNEAVVDLIRCCNVFLFVMFPFGMLCFGAVRVYIIIIIWNLMITFCILMFVGVGN